MRYAKFCLIITFVILINGCTTNESKNKEEIKELVYRHAKAWETGNIILLDSVLHEDVIFAYPARRMNRQQTFADFIDYNKSFRDTKIYINRIIIDGQDLAVEWQFASTSIKTGNRTAVSDAIMGKVKDGKIIIWKEYLDGRVSRMQAAGNLSLEEGEEPFPWPKKK